MSDNQNSQPQISSERRSLFWKKFNRWMEFGGWNTLTGKDELKELCFSTEMTRAEAEALVPDETIAQDFRDALQEILEENDEELEEYGERAFKFKGEYDEKWINWFIERGKNQ
jgi:hypothetical protein